MSRVYDIADDYVVRLAELHPIAATSMGIPGHDHELPDLSPAGHEQRAAHDRATLEALEGAPLEGERDRVALEAMSERLRLSADVTAAGEHFRALSILGSPLQSLRQTFELDAARLRGGVAQHRRPAGRHPRGARRLPRDPRRGRAARARRGAAAGRGVREADRGVGGQRRGAGLRPHAARQLRRHRHRERRASRRDRGRRHRSRRGVRRVRALPRRAVRAGREPRGPRRRRPLRAGRSPLHRHHARPRRDVRVGLAGAAARRGSDGRDRRADRAGPRRRGRERAARDRPRTRDRGRGRLPHVDAGAAGLDHRRHARQALRPARARATHRGADRAARHRRRDVLHRPLGGLLAARPHLVPDLRPHPIPRSGARSPSPTTRACPAITSRSR